MEPDEHGDGWTAGRGGGDVTRGPRLELRRSADVSRGEAGGEAAAATSAELFSVHEVRARSPPDSELWPKQWLKSAATEERRAPCGSGGA